MGPYPVKRQCQHVRCGCKALPWCAASCNNSYDLEPVLGLKIRVCLATGAALWFRQVIQDTKDTKEAQEAEEAQEAQPQPGDSSDTSKSCRALLNWMRMMRLADAAEPSKDLLRDVRLTIQRRQEKTFEKHRAQQQQIQSLQDALRKQTSQTLAAHQMLFQESRRTLAHCKRFNRSELVPKGLEEQCQQALELYTKCQTLPAECAP